MNNCKRLAPLTINETIITKAIKQSGIDIEAASTLNLDQIKLAYEWILAQLKNGNSSGSKYIEKHKIEQWAGYYIPCTAVEIAMYIAGISGLAKKPILPNISRLRYAGAGQHPSYAETLYDGSAYSNEYYSGAETGLAETELSLRDGLEQHRKFMGFSPISERSNYRELGIEPSYSKKKPTHPTNKSTSTVCTTDTDDTTTQPNCEARNNERR